MILNAILDQIDSHTEEVKKTFGAISSMERGWRPDPSKWSIDQHLEHLIVLNESYFPQFDSVIRNEKNPVLTAKIPGLPFLFGSMIKSSVQPQNSRKMATFSIWQPSITPSNADLVQNFEQHHSRLKEKLQQLEKFWGRNVIISSLANKWIVYSLETSLEIILLHEQRHIQHSRKLVELMMR